MWRQFVIIFMTVASCLAIPKAGSKRELQRLVRLPRIDFPLPLNFDRTTGFSVFPIASSAAADAAELLREAKGNPNDGLLYIEAARLHAAGGDPAESIRSYARAADLLGRKVQSDPGNMKALLGLAEALAGLGRLGEAQSTIDKAAALGPSDPNVHWGYIAFYKEKTWTAFAGNEHRFSNASFLVILDTMVRRGAGAHLERAQKELRSSD